MTGLIGIGLIFGLAYAMSNNRKAINYRLVGVGLTLQLGLALFILKTSLGQWLFHGIGQGITRILAFSDMGAGFVFGPLVNQPQTLAKLFGPAGSFLLAFKLVPAIIFVASLVSIAYHIGLMQRVVKAVAWGVSRLMGASGGEAISNAASIFVGQIEAQLLIKPYLTKMTMSELLAIMSGSMACIAGGVMAVYIQMGVPASYLLAASLMAAPGALVIAKIVWPETEHSVTQGSVELDIKPHTVNLIDAAAHGATDGLRVGLNVIGVLIAFVALIGCADWIVGKLGLLLRMTGLDLHGIGLDLMHLSLKSILGMLFSSAALCLGVPWHDAQAVGSLMGTKLVVNEFVAYSDMTQLLKTNPLALNPKSVVIASFALCGFANFGSVAMQIGGIGELAPTRKGDLARLGLTALACGTMASYVSAAIAGILF